MDVTGVLSADSGHRSAIPDAVAALWDKTGSALLPITIMPTPTNRTRLSLGKGSGDVTCPSERGAQHTRTRSQTSPLEESGTSTCPPDLLVCTSALRPGGPGPARAPLPLVVVHAGP